MVSKGCPATTVHTPPNPPDKKYFIGFADFFSDIFTQLFSTNLMLLSNASIPVYIARRIAELTAKKTPPLLCQPIVDCLAVAK
jgi:hypothetical protein